MTSMKKILIDFCSSLKIHMGHSWKRGIFCLPPVSYRNISPLSVSIVFFTLTIRVKFWISIILSLCDSGWLIVKNDEQSKFIVWKNYEIFKIYVKYTGLQFFSQKCPLFGFYLISTNFGSLIPNPKSVFDYPVRILQCRQFCVFLGSKIEFSKIWRHFFRILVTYSWRQ